MLDAVGVKWFAVLMPETETIKQRLLRVLYPEVDDTVAELIEAGQSWRQIADHIAGLAGVSVSHESLRQWYGKRAA